MSKKLVIVCLVLIAVWAGLYTQLTSNAQDSEVRALPIAQELIVAGVQHDEEAHQNRDRAGRRERERERDSRIRIERVRILREHDEPRRHHEGETEHHPRRREIREEHRDHPHPEHEEVRGRIEHLRAASAHLQQAGLGEFGEEIRHRADQMERELDRERERRAGGPHSELAEAHHAIRELQEAVERLRNEIREIHAHLKEHGKR